MNPHSFSIISSAATWSSTTWSSLAPTLADHLWQSTLFALAAALLTLTLRKNQAQARYALWLSASLKFLVPFSWLVALGNHLAWRHTPAAAGTGFYVVVEEISRPFTQPAASSISRAAPSLSSPTLAQMLPALLVALWFCGFIAVLLVWCVRWRRISAAMRDSVPLRQGREVEALRRQERAAGIRQRVEMLLSRATLEPGIFGLARPVLIWPEGISEHLENAHLEAVLAHELWHVRRRDNLAAAVHMLVEAIFWFHPLVWWMGARLVDERERACDEEVVELGSERRIYAESILKVCEFCVGSPLACVSGVTGADLKKRMVHIMSEHGVRELNFTKKLLLTAAGLAAIAVPIVFGLANAKPVQAQSQAETATAAAPAFQSFSIKPGEAAPASDALGHNRAVRMMYGADGFVATNVTLQSLIQEAYGVQASQISGPSDLLSSTYDVTAKVDPSAGFRLGPGPDHAKAQLMLQEALAEHAKLVVHHETKELPVYALVVAEGGSKLQPSSTASAMNGPIFYGPTGGMTGGPTGGMAGPAGQPAHFMRIMSAQGPASAIGAQAVSTGDIARQLAMQLEVPVFDKTGLKGSYDFNLHWSSTANQGAADADSASADASSGNQEPSLFTAIQQQLGLKLVLQKQPMDTIVIDHIEKPAGD
jgi:bla regulator protein blaR1